MDLNLLWALLIVVGVNVLVYFVVKKMTISKQQISTIKELFGLSIAVIDELNLKQEEDIMRISNICYNALDLAYVLNDNKDDIIENAYNYAINTMEKVGLETNENRQRIVRTLIEIGVDTILNLPEEKKEEE